MINYIVSTGTIIKDYLDTRKITQKELAEITNSSEKHISNIINGKARVTPKFALKLEDVFPDVKAEFWLEIESKYQMKLLRKEETKEKFSDLDLKELSSEYQFDHIFKGFKYTLNEKAEGVLRLLETNSFEETNELVRKQANLYLRDGGNPKSQFIWMKLCEEEFYVQNDEYNIKTFNKEELRKNLKLLKKLIYNTDFEFVINSIRKFLNRFGVGLVVLEAVPNSKIRGATTLVDNIPAIFISTRYKELEEIYFTVFYEIKHLLEDDLNKENYQHISYEDDNCDIEANNFVREQLIDENDYLKLVERIDDLSERELVLFANKQRVIVDVVIGLLGRNIANAQDKSDFYNKYSHLKTRIK